MQQRVLHDGSFIAYQKPLIPLRTDTSHERALNRVLDHMDGPWMGSPELQGLACCSYPPEIVSCWQSVTRMTHTQQNWHQQGYKLIEQILLLF